MPDDLQSFADELGRAASGVLTDVARVAKRAAQNLKNDYRAEAEASVHFAPVAPAWSYDEEQTETSVRFEVGPDKSVAGGALANIYYFGSPRGGGGTGDIDGPLDREVPRLTKALADDVLGRLL